MNLIDAWHKAKEGQYLYIADGITYPFCRFKQGTLMDFCNKELANYEVNILRTDWDIIPNGDKFNYEYENGFILGILRNFRQELKTNKNESEIMDMYACQLTAYMNGKCAGLRR